MDPLSYIRWQFMEWHVLLHLLILETFAQDTMWFGPSWRYSWNSAGLMPDITISHIFCRVFTEFFHRDYVFILFVCRLSTLFYKWITNSFAIIMSWQRAKTKVLTFDTMCSALLCDNPLERIIVRPQNQLDNALFWFIFYLSQIKCQQVSMPMIWNMAAILNLKTRGHCVGQNVFLMFNFLPSLDTADAMHRGTGPG